MAHLQVPAQFMNMTYDYERHPQAAIFDFNQGANCQLWAYALLKYFGINVPPFRSSQLWEDEAQTELVSEFRPLDLLPFNHQKDAWGAHVVVYLGDDTVAHLSKDAGVPVVCTMQDLSSCSKYKYFIGAKRIKVESE